MYHFNGRSLPGLAILACVATLAQARGQNGPGSRYAGLPQDAFSVVAEVRAKPGKEAELRRATLPLIDLARGDPKNLVYFLQEDRTSAGHFVFYEVYANQADFEAHNAQPYVQAWFAKLPDLALGGVQSVTMKVLGAPGD